MLNISDKITKLINSHRYLSVVIFVLFIIFFINIGNKPVSNLPQEPIYTVVKEETGAINSNLKTLDDIKNVYGNYKETAIDNNLSLYTFKYEKSYGDNDYNTLKAVVDKSGKVQAYVIPDLENKKDGLENEKTSKGLGEPDFEMYIIGAFSTKLYVFLEDGLAYEASPHGEILKRIIFIPTNKETFLEMFPDKYSESYSPAGY